MYRTLSLGMALVILAGYFVFTMKREVENLNLTINSLNKQIVQERSNINLLKAEFSHLTSPSRLKILAEIHLGLTNIKPHNMVSDPLRISEKRVIISKSRHQPRKTKNWRYKHREDRGIHKASFRINSR